MKISFDRPVHFEHFPENSTQFQSFDCRDIRTNTMVFNKIWLLVTISFLGLQDDGPLF